MDQTTRFRLGVAAAALAGCAVGGIAFGPAFAGALQVDDDETTTTTEAPADDGTTTTEPPADEGTENESEEQTDGERCGPGRGFLRETFGAAAAAIGIEESALREALAGGQTIAQVAEANGVDAAAVVDAMVAEAQERLAEAVANGDITQERADEIAANLEERYTDIVNGEFEFGRGPGGRGPGRWGPGGD